MLRSHGGEVMSRLPVETRWGNFLYGVFSVSLLAFGIGIGSGLVYGLWLAVLTPSKCLVAY